MSEIDIIEIKKGDYFCEMCYSAAIRFQAIEDGHKEGDQYKVKGRTLGSDKVIDFLQTEGCFHYGPKLYKGLEVPYCNVKYLN